MTVVTSSQAMDSIDLWQLLPEWSSVLNFSLGTGTELSAWFVLTLLLLFFGFLGYSALRAIQAAKRIRWLKSLVQDLTADTVAEKRQDMVEQAEQVNHEAGHLWLEFDETLVEAERGNRAVLYNTIDADYFFNTSTLAAGITESRMLAAVPGFLTALGVIGTFIGLQLGLAQLNIASDVSIEEMKTGVAGVINGAKFAFLTSVWGVFLSVLFNFIEKWVERMVRRKVNGLQKTIDALFPRISAEGQLQRIAIDGEQSRETLQGLAEKIGEKMQESLIEATAGIQSGLEQSLEKIMAPAINKLVDETSDGNQKALESLLGNFMDKFGEQGVQQRAAMDESSARMNATLDGLNSSMSAFINKMENSQSASEEREKELVNTISLQVTQLVEQGNEQKRLLTGFVDEQLGNMTTALDNREQAAQQREKELVTKISAQVDYLVASAKEQSDKLAEFVDEKLGAVNQTFSTQQQDAADREKKRNAVFVEQTEAMKQGTAQLLERVEQGLQAQMQAGQQLLEQGKGLQASVESSVRASAEASASMKDSAAELNSAASSINVFGGHIREAGDQLSGAVTKAVASTEELASLNQASSKEMQTLRTQLVRDAAEFQTIIQKLSGVIELADSSFDNMADHQQNYLNGLKQNVEELAAKMTSLLEDYATQANGQTARHLSVWAEGTTQYASQMNNAVQALSGVVDEIEVKLGR